LHERVQREAEERQVSVNYIVVRAIERYLDCMVPVAELQLERDERTHREGSAR